MAAGLPTVAFAEGGPLDIVENGATGILAPPSGAAALTEALQPLVRDSSLRAALGAAGRRRALEHFTTRAAAAHIEELLLELAA
jgi:glycosyltransferase involved in cell wall biosynthesis